MNRKHGALALAALLAALTLTACGGGSMAGSASDSSTSAMEYQEYDIGMGGGDAGFFYGGYDSTVEEPAEAPESETGGGESRLANAKMIYTANIEAETMDFDACSADLEKLVEQMGGYLEYASSNSYGDGYRSGTYTARIPAARFKAFLKSVGDIGHITYQDKSSENISEQYYDIESRLATQRTKLERLQALLARAENMEDIITIESAIAETELQIEQLTGSLRQYDALVDFSTVYIQLREVSRLSDVETTPPGFSTRLGTAFSGSLSNFSDFLQNLAIFLAYSWIWLVILALVAAAVLCRIRRRKDRTVVFGRKKPDDKPPEK